jgi:hypothetical protein
LSGKDGFGVSSVRDLFANGIMRDSGILAVYFVFAGPLCYLLLTEDQYAIAGLAAASIASLFKKVPMSNWGRTFLSTFSLAAFALGVYWKYFR